MKIAVFSDVHDNLVRWLEAVETLKSEKIKIGICCGDIGELQTLETVAQSLKTLYLALGNLDYKIKDKIDSGLPTSPRLHWTGRRNDKEEVKDSIGLFPENVRATPDFGEVELRGRKIAFAHNHYLGRQLAKSGKYDVVFYGHTHTPWEEKIGNTVLLNPGEISGQFGRASFAIYDLKKMKAELKILE